MNDDPRFGLWVERLIQALNAQWKCDVLLKEDRYARFNLTGDDQFMKIELINDVPARIGVTQNHVTLGRVDTAENILANKISALLGRDEPKDLADIWGFCFIKGLNVRDAITNAQSKAIGVFPVDLGRALCSATRADWDTIRWINAPPVETFLSELNELGESLLLPGNV